MAFGVNGSVIPAFAKMFKEVGVSLPLLTELVLGAGGWVWAIAVLTNLHAAALVRAHQTGVHLCVAAFLVAVLGIALGCFALFLRLCETIQKL